MNDNFMPDMPEREVDAYPYPNEDVRAYFAARGRQPTPDEQIVLDECLCADSRYNLLSTRYGDVRIADPEVARCFQSFIKKRRPQNGFFSLGEVALLGLERPCTVPPRPGDLLLYIEDLPFDQKLQTLIRRHAFFGLQALLALSTGLTVDLGAFRRPAASSAFMICLQCVFWPQMNGLSTGYAHWCGRPHPMCRHP